MPCKLRSSYSSAAILSTTFQPEDFLWREGLVMKNTYCVGAVAALALGAAVAHADVDIGVQPPPALVYAKPVIIEQPPPHVVVAEPLYLHVPPEHARSWRLHCHEYHACNRQVYFVKSREYDPENIREREHERREAARHEIRHEEHVMRAQERREERREEHYEHGHGHDHDHDRNRDHDHHN